MIYLIELNLIVFDFKKCGNSMIYDFTLKDNKGNDISLASFKGKVLLIVNTATHCGFTPQYNGLEALYEKYREKGFEILDVPCNQFAFQAPESAAKIGQVCQLKYGVQFPQFDKIKVNGKGEHPLYTYLKSQKGDKIKWNFTKLLIDREGTVTARFEPKVKPEDISARIEELL